MRAVFTASKAGAQTMLTSTQLQRYHEDGFILVPSFYTAADDERLEAALAPARRSGWGGSGRYPCSHLVERGFADVCHTLPLIKRYLNPTSVAIARQVLAADVLLRCGILVDLEPNDATPWHRDVQGLPFTLFMHYLQGASAAHGCLRVIPGSHLMEEAYIDAEFDRVAVEQNLSHCRRSELVVHPREVPLEVRHEDLIVRDSRLWHGTYVNKSDRYRTLLTWAFIRRQDASEWRFPFPEQLQFMPEFTTEERRLMGWA